MTYLLKFRALCDYCEKAEASLWCIQDHCALCKECDEKIHRSQRHERVEVVKSSVMSTLCNDCNTMPASYYHEERDATLCELCVKQQRERAGEEGSERENLSQSDIKDAGSSRIIPLQDAHVTESIVFDKMDFTCIAMKKKRSRRSARLILAGLGAQETPESKVDRWLHDKGQKPVYDREDIPQEGEASGTGARERVTSNLGAFAAPVKVLNGTKRKLENEKNGVSDSSKRKGPTSKSPM
mmetsp:Transcript_12361/g.37702  ORF Transcript_12361/g.37702 Transcript_12361/m.37702 type:complete len:240 (-) Transcript_12361:231-950(-)